MAIPSVPELLIILAIIVLLFGAKKIPDLAKGLGSGIKNFKKAVKDDDEIASQPTQSVANKEIEENKNTKANISEQETTKKV